MEISWLDDFLALSEVRNFSRAAESRHISQPAFSRRIRMLEGWIGAPLIERDTRNVTLTAAGEAFIPLAADVVRRLASARAQARETAGAEAATLRVCSTHALSMTFFPNWLETLDEASDAPHVVSLVTDNMTGGERLLLEGQAQFLLCHDHPLVEVPMKPPFFRYLDVGHDILRPVSAPCPSGEGARHSLSASGPGEVPFLSYSGTSGLGRILGAVLDGQPTARSLRPTFSSHVAAVLTRMAKAGKGVAWLPVSLIETELGNGELVAAGTPQNDIEIGIRVYRSRARQSHAAEAFWDRILAIQPAPA
jgi:DNA-binding transcriptional LysR family regulator